MCDNNPTYSATKDNASLRKLHNYVWFKIIGGQKLHKIVLHTVQNVSVRKNNITIKTPAKRRIKVID